MSAMTPRHCHTPSGFYLLARTLAPRLFAAALLCALAGLLLGLVLAPADALQGEVYRILFIHVPAAWMSLLLYVAMALGAAIGLARGSRLAFCLMHATAPSGALFCFLALWSGALWGRPTWGSFWVWDARLTSELLLLLLYAGFLALTRALGPGARADQCGALIALAGVLNVPVIHFSVSWWSTLHQGASLSLGRPGAITGSMLAALLLMTLAAMLYGLATTLLRSRTLLLEGEQGSAWAEAEIARLNGGRP